MKWAYSYSTWLIVISDSRDALVQLRIYGTEVLGFGKI